MKSAAKFNGCTLPGQSEALFFKENPSGAGAHISRQHTVRDNLPNRTGNVYHDATRPMLGRPERRSPRTQPATLIAFCIVLITSSFVRVFHGLRLPMGSLITSGTIFSATNVGPGSERIRTTLFDHVSRLSYA